jgi:hypothetical protein
MGLTRTEPLMLIVARAEDRLYHYLKRTFADVVTVEVVRDRRFRERRQPQPGAPAVERRGGQDRRRRDVSDALAVPGWALVKEPPAERKILT